MSFEYLRYIIVRLLYDKICRSLQSDEMDSDNDVDDSMGNSLQDLQPNLASSKRLRQHSEETDPQGPPSKIPRLAHTNPFDDYILDKKIGTTLNYMPCVLLDCRSIS